MMTHPHNVMLLLATVKINGKLNKGKFGQHIIYT